MGNTVAGCSYQEDNALREQSYNNIPSIRSAGSRLSQAPSLPTIEEERSSSSQIGDNDIHFDEIMVKRSKSTAPIYTSDASDMMMNLIDLRHEKEEEEKKIDDLAHDYLVAQEQAIAAAVAAAVLPQERDQPSTNEFGSVDSTADATADEFEYKYVDALPEDTKKKYQVAYEERSGNIEIERIPDIHQVFSNENTRIISNSAYPQVINQGARTLVEGVLLEGVKEETTDRECAEKADEEIVPTEVLPIEEVPVSPHSAAQVFPGLESTTSPREQTRTAIVAEEQQHPNLDEPDLKIADFDRQAYIATLQPPAFDEELDLEFVEQYDTAFNEFVASYPHFLIHNPDLVHNLRVTKLQKCLERGDEIEADLIRKVNEIRTQKADMELFYQRQLKEASRLKAAREIHLKASLDEFRHETKMAQGRLNWDLLLSSQTRVQKLYDLRQHLKAIETPSKWEELLKMLPDDSTDAQAIRDAVLAPSLSSGTPTKEQENDLRQFQVDNAFLNAEVSVLMKKLAYQKLAAKKHAWVETVLLRMDPKAIRKLKSRYQKKLGVPVA